MVQGRDDVRVASAGVSAMRGQPPSYGAVEAMSDAGIDISNYRSQPISEALVERATHIFAMTRGHLETIQMLFPNAAEKAFLVREFDESSTGSPDVPDPIGQSLEMYRRCRDAIQRALPSVLQFVDHSDSPGNLAPRANLNQPLKIALGSDRDGVALKQRIHKHLQASGYQIADLGAFAEDYAEFALKVSQELEGKTAGYGIVVCRSGIGMTMAANRFPQIRASLADNEEKARLSRQQDDSNVLCLPSASLEERHAVRIVDTYLTTPFQGGTHKMKTENISNPIPAANALANTDPEIFEAIEAEARRQSENIELIASENFTSRAVMQAQGSCLTNKYAEGYPGKRWYGGCEHVDVVEQLAIDRVKKLFGAEHANVQPHSGSQANAAVYFSVLKHGDKILTMDLSHGGHLTHGNKANFSGRFYEVSHYGVSEGAETIDYDNLAKQAEQVQPKMITVGASAYPRTIDFKRMREIADSVGAYLFADMAHIAGLVAAGEHPSPVGIADFVTSTTHKSLRGPRGGIILCQEKYAKDIDSLVFPGVQGGPLMHVIAAKAVCFLEALQPEFKAYQRQIVLNAKSLAARIAKNGWRLVSGGTDNHLMLVDVRPQGLTGKEAQETLDHASITVNKNAIPFDTLSVFKTGGIRVGTPAVTTRGMREEEMMEIADFIHDALTQRQDPDAIARVRDAVREFTRRFPIP